MGHVAVKWDSKKEWAAKLAYTFADDESVGAYSLTNDLRYCDAIETPYEDISRGNNYFRNGLMNMGALKLQAEFRPRDTKHYFRIAGDFLNELDETVSNDLARYVEANNVVAAAAHNIVAGVPAGYVKTNTALTYGILWYRRCTANGIHLCISLQLAENTKKRVGYTNFDMDGKETKALGATAAVRCWPWCSWRLRLQQVLAEIISKF
jgi:hypothetical protein